MPSFFGNVVAMGYHGDYIREQTEKNVQILNCSVRIRHNKVLTRPLSRILTY